MSEFEGHEGEGGKDAGESASRSSDDRESTGAGTGTPKAAGTGSAGSAGTGSAEPEVAGDGEPEAAGEPEPAGSAEAEPAGSAEGGDEPEGNGRPSVKIPGARDIGRGDFTPHGIGGGRRPPRRPPVRPARRRLFYVVGVVVVLGLAAGGVAVAEAMKPSHAVSVSGPFGKAPDIKIPKVNPSSSEQVKVLIPGNGAPVVTGNLVVANYVGYTWIGKTGKKFNDTYAAAASGQGQALMFPAGKLTSLPPLDKALQGKKAGSRVLVTLPGKDLDANTLQQLSVKKTDAIVLAVDVTATFSPNLAGTMQPTGDPKLPAVTDAGAGKAPVVKIPHEAAPGSLTSKVLIQGSGAVVRSGQTLVANYVGQIWDTGKVFDSSWQHGQPVTFPIGKGQVIPGWDKTLVGQKAGTRMLLAIPPADGYGKQGQAQAGIKGTDTLVFVVDILGSF